MKFFEPSDFECKIPWDLTVAQVREHFCNIANAKLERESKRVYSSGIAGEYGPFENDTKRYMARLICIEEIKPCSHKDVEGTIWSHGYPDWYMMCKCGAKVKPKTFEEIK